jgi:hypothetical protein
MAAMARIAAVPEAVPVGPLPAEAVRKLGEILKTIEQSKIFRDFSDSEGSKASKKRTKPVRVKTRGSFFRGLRPSTTFPFRLRFHCRRRLQSSLYWHQYRE